MPDSTLAHPTGEDSSLRIAPQPTVPSNGQPLNTTRAQNTVALATEFVVVSFRQPKSGTADGWYDYETFTDVRDAEKAHDDLVAGEYPRARAVCIFASRHGVPIGRVL